MNSVPNLLFCFLLYMLQEFKTIRMKNYCSFYSDSRQLNKLQSKWWKPVIQNCHQNSALYNRTIGPPVEETIERSDFSAPGGKCGNLYVNVHIPFVLRRTKRNVADITHYNFVKSSIFTTRTNENARLPDVNSTTLNVQMSLAMFNFTVCI